MAWVVLAVVVGLALLVGTRDTTPLSDAERVDHVAGTVRCPACRGESARDSHAPAAANIRRLIARAVGDGKSDDEIRDELVASYGGTILLTPPRSGVAGLVWVIPVVALVGGLGGVALAFRRWRTA